MKVLLISLKNQDAVLFWFGLICLLGGAACLGLSLTTTRQVMGLNAFIKPAKFCVSIWLFCWTMACFLPLLNRPVTQKAYAWMVVLVMGFELAVIIGQASRGKLSHFNITSSTDALLFSLMGVAITILTLWTGYIGVLFFTRPIPAIPASYLWGIRLGILLFVIFAFEGGLMAGRLSHTVGAVDGGPGLPGTNWSTRNGDLRVAHFVGMHALQVLPLFGYFVARQPVQVIIVGIAYLGLAVVLLMQALTGRPLLG